MSFGSEYDEEDLAQLRLSTQALDVLVLEKEISRDAFLAERLGAKLFDKTSRMKHKSDRNLKFEHLVRIYDALIASNYILADAAMEIIRGADADAIIEKLESDIDNDIEKYKKSREGALQRALTEPNDPIASKVKALKVSSSGGMPELFWKGRISQSLFTTEVNLPFSLNKLELNTRRQQGFQLLCHRFLRRGRLRRGRKRKSNSNPPLM